VFDGAPAPAANAVQVSLEPAAGGLTSLGFGETRPATTDENGVFTLNGVMPGRYRLNARVVSRPSPTPAPQPGQVAAPNVQNAVTTAPGWTVLASRISGQDAFVSLFEVRAGESLTDAEIVLTNKPADISGKLIDAADKPVPNMTVVLFPADRSLWLANASRVNRISRPNATGTFSFPNAVPGEYYLAVLTELDNADWAEPEFKEQLEAAAIKVTVAKGEKKVLDFRIGGPPPLSGPFESPAR
jgi:hypothetical protein